jgi:hypothetical protein
MDIYYYLIYILTASLGCVLIVLGAALTALPFSSDAPWIRPQGARRRHLSMLDALLSRFALTSAVLFSQCDPPWPPRKKVRDAHAWVDFSWELV